MKTCKHFKLYELVSKQVYEKYGNRAWQFFDPRLLVTIDWLRETLDLPITINDWYWGGSFQQRGFRCNMDGIVKNKTDAGKIYCSAHVMAKAIDFDVKGMSAQAVRDWLMEHKAEIPYPIRLEKDVTWVHLDTYITEVKVYLFAA